MSSVLPDHSEARRHIFIVVALFYFERKYSMAQLIKTAHVGQTADVHKIILSSPC
jgi:hypothetical protein